MMEIIEDLPSDTLGIALRGHITAEDYKNILIPVAEKKFADEGKIKMFIYIADLDGIDLSAMWEDTKFGLKHWSDFSHFALVTDIDWVKSTAAFFTPLIPGEVRMYSTDHEAKAREWLVTAHGHSEAA